VKQCAKVTNWPLELPIIIKSKYGKVLIQPKAVFVILSDHMDKKPVRVVIIDDHPIVRAGIRMVLEAAHDIQIVGDGSCGEDALRLVSELQPDVLVLDISLPDQNGLEITRQLRAQAIKTAILILTVHNDSQTVFGLLEAGASGYVLKDDALETLGIAVWAAAHGETWLSSRIAEQVVHRALNGEVNQPAKPVTNLTVREMEVLQLLAQGLSNDAIARQLTLTMRTVQNHVSAIYGKLGVESRAEAVLYAIRSGWAPIPVDQKDGSRNSG
jgi:DNA-binding NarL/FixJ family response regulator